jgi:hypothetical protein
VNSSTSWCCHVNPDCMSDADDVQRRSNMVNAPPAAAPN